MRKIKVRPTPAQARLLEQLAQHPALRIQWYERTAGRWIGPGSRTAKNLVGEPRQLTMRKVRDEEWIQKDDPESQFSYWELADEGRQAVALLDKDYIFPVAEGMTAADIDHVLLAHHQPPAWFTIRELFVEQHGTNRRFIDFFAMRLTMGEYDSPYMQRIAYEIKVTREDFRRELKDPTKRQAAMDLAHRFYFVAPWGIIPPEDVPEDCGLMQVREDQTTHKTIKAPDTPNGHPDWKFVASIFRSLNAS